MCMTIFWFRNAIRFWVASIEQGLRGTCFKASWDSVFEIFSNRVACLRVYMILSAKFAQFHEENTNVLPQTLVSSSKDRPNFSINWVLRSLWQSTFKFHPTVREDWEKWTKVYKIKKNMSEITKKEECWTYVSISANLLNEISMTWNAIKCTNLLPSQKTQRCTFLSPCLN